MYSPNSKYFQIPDIAIICPSKKALPYTITPIGGPADLARWKKDQALLAEARDMYLKPIREATRQRAISMVANQNADTSLDAVARAEITHAKVRKGLEEAARGELRSLGSFSEPKLTIRERIKNAAIDLWKTAFPDKV